MWHVRDSEWRNQACRHTAPAADSFAHNVWDIQNIVELGLAQQSLVLVVPAGYSAKAAVDPRLFTDHHPKRRSVTVVSCLSRFETRDRVCSSNHSRT